MTVSLMNILLLVFVGVVAISMLAQWIVLLVLAGRLKAMSESVTPVLQPLEQGARALPGLVRDAQTLIAEVRPTLQSTTANLLEISIIAKDRVREADRLAGDISDRLELQMVRIDEALSTALASAEQVTTAVRDSLLRPVRDVNALVQGVRTGMDFFFRRRAGSPSAPAYQDEEMFI